MSALAQAAAFGPDAQAAMNTVTNPAGSTAPRFQMMETLGVLRGSIVIPEGDACPLSKSVTAVGLRAFLETGGKKVGETA